MVIFSWRTRKLKVDATVLMPFQEASITQEANIKETKSGNESSVTFKNRKPKTFSMTVLLLAAAGVDVAKEVKGWQRMVDGVPGRIYIGGKDLFDRDMLLTGCPATEMVFSGKGVMKSAKLKMTFQQGKAPEAKRAAGPGGGPGGASGTHTKYHTYVEAWAVNETSKKKTHISTVKGGTRAAGERWTQPTAPTGYIAPTEYRAILYAKKDCPFCKAIEQHEAALAAQEGKNQDQTGFDDSAYKPKKEGGQQSQ